MGWKFLAVLLGALTALWGSGFHATSARETLQAFTNHQADTLTGTDPGAG